MKLENMKEIIKMFEESQLAKMELEVDDMKIKMEKPTGADYTQEMIVPAPSTLPPVVSSEPSVAAYKSGYWVKAPIVGTFYNTRAVGSTPFIEIGQHVAKGDVLCIIEAMKVMNEIHSPLDGTIQEILVTNDSMVEFDQDLIRISEAA